MHMKHNTLKGGAEELASHHIKEFMARDAIMGSKSIELGHFEKSAYHYEVVRSWNPETRRLAHMAYNNYLESIRPGWHTKRCAEARMASLCNYLTTLHKLGR